MDTVHQGVFGRPFRAAASGSRRLACGCALVMIITFLLPVGAVSAKPANPSNAQIDAAQRRHRENVAAFGRLAGRMAALDGEIQRAQTTVDLSVARYNDLGRRLQEAIATVKQTDAAQRLAAAEAVSARDLARIQIRESYIRGPQLSITALAFSREPSDLMSAFDVQHYLGLRSRDAVSTLFRAQVVASNTEAAARQAEGRAQDLQAEAARQRDSVLAALQAVQSRRVILEETRRRLDQQVALAFGRLRKLRTQRAAFDAWTAQNRRNRAAEAARQALIERQRQGQNGPPTSPAIRAQSSGAWGSPLPAGSYSISTCFCMRWGDFHYGVDLAAGYGTPIYAVGSGTVVAAGAAQGFGNWVVVDHGDGSVSVYGHMRVLNVTYGQTVHRGQVIALVGSEGFSTGPHLHFEVRLGGIDGSRVDPQVWLAQRGVYI